MTKKRAKRFPLLIYQAVAKRWRGLAFWLIPAGIVLWWGLQRNHAAPSARPWLALVISGVGALIFLYTILAHRAHIRCYEDHFTLQGPLYPVVFSYHRVKSLRPTEFAKIHPPDEEKAARWRLYRDLWGKTVVVIDLNGYPLPKGWLRLWFNDYLFHPKTVGLVVLTEDWMALIRQIETHRTRLKRNRRRS
jgi:hypothetical protein